MEKSVIESTGSSSNNNHRHQQQHQHQQPQPQPQPQPRDVYLKHLNRISHKISKPPPHIRRPPIDNRQHPHSLNHHHQLAQDQGGGRIPVPVPVESQAQQQQQQQQSQQQPPVYNINKSDFRDVVQKLTGSPAHDRFATPPPIQPPKPPSSRLQRIRPPPLAQLSNRPPHPLNNTLPIPPPLSTIVNPNFITNPNHIARSVPPLSPLPPFPTHAAVESPISAYMRYLQSTTPTPIESDPKRFQANSPRWNNPNSFQLQHQHQFLLPSPTMAMPPSLPFMIPNSPLGFPNSPLGFGRISSPRSPYPLLSPTLLFSPTSGQLGFPQFPQSPTMPIPSPRWRGH